MNKNSLSLKIVLWITLFFIGLFSLNIAVFFFASDTLVSRTAEREIIDVAEDVAETLTIVGDIVYYDEDDDERFIFFEDGTAFAIYLNNEIFQGQYPADLPQGFVLQPFLIQTYQTDTTRWYIYDIPLQENYTLRAFYNYRGGLQVYNQLLTTLSLISFLLFILSVGGVIFFVTKAMKPIQAMAATAEDIASQSNFALRVPESKSKDEVGMLTRVLNQMLDKIESSLQREKDFSANVSHELRTPLTVIKAQIEYLESKIKNPSLAKDFIEINAQINWMQKMIDEMLTLARMKYHSDIEVEEIHLKTLIEMMQETFNLEADQKGITLIFNLASDDLKMKTSLTFLIRILNNIIGNALKFTPNNGMITVTMSKDSSGINIDVEDTGDGIAKEDLEKIFDPLYQVDFSRGNPQSLGLGLSLTKEMVRLLNGRISMKSTLKKGTSVTVWLPQTIA